MTPDNEATFKGLTIGSIIGAIKVGSDPKLILFKNNDSNNKTILETHQKKTPVPEITYYIINPKIADAEPKGIEEYIKQNPMTGGMALDDGNLLGEESTDEIFNYNILKDQVFIEMCEIINDEGANFVTAEQEQERLAAEAAAAAAKAEAEAAEAKAQQERLAAEAAAAPAAKAKAQDAAKAEEAQAKKGEGPFGFYPLVSASVLEQSPFGEDVEV